MNRFLILAIGAVASIGIVATAAAFAADGPLPDELREVRAATARYHSFEQALKNGYTLREGEPCAARPGLGVMGYHVANLALMDDPAIDPLQPEILMYLPDRSGELKLVAFEYWKADADGSLVTDDDRPSLFGVPFDGPMLGHGPTMPVHYDLHVWIWEHNPAGVFAMWNPALACP
jgi:hypothetical protein